MNEKKFTRLMTGAKTDATVQSIIFSLLRELKKQPTSAEGIKNYGALIFATMEKCQDKPDEKKYFQPKIKMQDFLGEMLKEQEVPTNKKLLDNCTGKVYQTMLFLKRELTRGDVISDDIGEAMMFFHPEIGGHLERNFERSKGRIDAITQTFDGGWASDLGKMSDEELMFLYNAMEKGIMRDGFHLSEFLNDFRRSKIQDKPDYYSYFTMTGIPYNLLSHMSNNLGDFADLPKNQIFTKLRDTEKQLRKDTAKAHN